MRSTSNWLAVYQILTRASGGNHIPSPSCVPLVDSVGHSYLASETPLGFYQQLYVVDVIFAVKRKRQVYMYHSPDSGSIVAYSKAETDVR
jgi:hypothetical protein